MATYSPSKITKDGNTYNFTDDTKIPLTGTSALAGSIVPSTDNAYDLGDSTYGLRSIYTNKMYLKGSTIFKLVDDSFICLGGATAQANGANLTLNGKNRSTSTGEFKLEARDGTYTQQLIGKPDGTLTWNGKNIDCIEERGTEYIRYTNGIQICWGYVSAGTEVSINFLKSFLQPPTISVTSNTQNTDSIVTATCTNQTITVYCKFAYYGSFYIAIGRWK